MTQTRWRLVIHGGAGSERIAHDNPEHEAATSHREVNGACATIEGGDQVFDGVVDVLDDHRDPPVQPPATEGGLDRSPAALVVLAIGDDHRLLADDIAKARQFVTDHGSAWREILA